MARDGPLVSLTYIGLVESKTIPIHGLLSELRSRFFFIFPIPLYALSFLFFIVFFPLG